MHHLRSLISCQRPLIDVFIDALQRSTRLSILVHLGGSHRYGDDDDQPKQPSLRLEDADDDVDAQQPSARTLLPDEMLAAVLLARALDSQREVIAAIADGGVVVIEAPDAKIIAPLVDVLRRCVLGPHWTVKDGDALKPSHALEVATTTLVLFDRDGSEKSHNASTGNAKIGIALQMRCPIIGIAADIDRVLPRDLIRIADHRVTVPPIDAEAIVAVIAAVTGKAPEPIDPDLAKRTTTADLMLAIRSDRGPAGCLMRLRRLVDRTKADDDTTPMLRDLHGLGEAREWALNLVDDLRDYKAGKIPWAAVAKSVLIWGPPGTGKTLFAKSLAKTANVNFESTSYSEWQSKNDGHLGTVTRAIRDCFAAAKKNAPSILFIDEIDVLPKRKSGRYADEWWDAVTTTLLQELDGFTRREGVVVITACNSDPKKNLDPALVRSGRLDKTVYIPLPDTIALVGILRTHLGQDLAGVDLRATAVAAYGTTGADIERFVRGARRRARVANRDVTITDLMEEIRDGRADFPEDVRRRVAYHEAGHAICAMALAIGAPQSLAIHANGGTTLLGPGTERAHTNSDLQQFLAYLLAGRAAEELACGDICAGAGGGDTSDLAIASSIAVQIEASYGLGAQGPLYFGSGDQGTLLRIPEIRSAVRRALEQAQIDARRLLETHRASLDQLAAALLRNNFLDRDEVRDAVDPALYANVEGKPALTIGVAGPAPTESTPNPATQNRIPMAPLPNRAIRSTSYGQEL